MAHSPYPESGAHESAAHTEDDVMATPKPVLWGATLAAVLLATTAQAATLTVSPGPDAQERLQTALLDAKPGDVVSLAAGRFDVTDGLSLDVDNVT
ncbi:MAG: hypothetical protein Q7T23_18595, partial [Phenylobacterium sp.]|nr:hypothetical protein [Phenylobacterium sp.]